MKNKAVVKIGVTDAKSKKAAKKALVDIRDFSSYTLDFENGTLVVIGYMDPTELVHNLRKFVSADLVIFGPEKDEGKSRKNDGGGGNVDKKQKPPPPPPPQQQKPVCQPPIFGIGTSGYGNCNQYY